MLEFGWTEAKGKTYEIIEERLGRNHTQKTSKRRRIKKKMNKGNGKQKKGNVYFEKHCKYQIHFYNTIVINNIFLLFAVYLQLCFLDS